MRQDACPIRAFGAGWRGVRIAERRGGARANQAARLDSGSQRKAAGAVRHVTPGRSGREAGSAARGPEGGTGTSGRDGGAE